MEARDHWAQKGKGHRERLRDKFLEGGIERFSDEEIIEFLLTLGTPRKDVKPSAREALKKFGSLSAVLSAPIEKLIQIKGIGPKNALYLSFIHQIARRYLRDRAIQTTYFRSSQEVFDYLFHSMRDLKREVFKVLFLNRKNQLIEDRDMFYGTIAASAVYPREVISTALDLKAASMVFVHNHPSGDPNPSKDDNKITKQLVWAAKLLQIQVLDHLIIGNGRYFSYADQGLLRRFEAEFESFNRSVIKP